MNKFLCMITGGHRYKDSNLESKYLTDEKGTLLTNKCIKCGTENRFILHDEVVKNLIRKDISNEYDLSKLWK